MYSIRLLLHLMNFCIFGTNDFASSLIILAWVGPIS